MVYFEKTFDAKDEAEEFMKHYSEQYPPAGYGTYYRTEERVGKVVVKVSRGSSYD